jgi:hypothetical protein
LGNGPTFNDVTIENVGSTLQEKTFDNMANSSLDYEYVLPLSGLHFLVHQQSPTLVIGRIPSQCRTAQQLIAGSFNEQHILVLRPNNDELCKERDIFRLCESIEMDMY